MSRHRVPETVIVDDGDRRHRSPDVRPRYAPWIWGWLMAAAITIGVLGFAGAAMTMAPDARSAIGEELPAFPSEDQDRLEGSGRAERTPGPISPIFEEDLPVWDEGKGDIGPVGPINEERVAERTAEIAEERKATAAAAEPQAPPARPIGELPGLPVLPPAPAPEPDPPATPEVVPPDEQPVEEPPPPPAEEEPDCASPLVECECDHLLHIPGLGCIDVLVPTDPPAKEPEPTEGEAP